MLSEIVGETGDISADIVINLFDFDTGITRHELNGFLKHKEYWEMRFNQVNSITDPDIKFREDLKLYNEMMKDPFLKKVSKGILGFGTKTSLGILEMLL